MAEKTPDLLEEYLKKHPDQNVNCCETPDKPAEDEKGRKIITETEIYYKEVQHRIIDFMQFDGSAKSAKEIHNFLIDKEIIQFDDVFRYHTDFRDFDDFDFDEENEETVIYSSIGAIQPGDILLISKRRDKYQVEIKKPEYDGGEYVKEEISVIEVEDDDGFIEDIEVGSKVLKTSDNYGKRRRRRRRRARRVRRRFREIRSGRVDD